MMFMEQNLSKVAMLFPAKNCGEMSSNLQEIIHISRNTRSSGEAFLSAMAGALGQAKPDAGDLPRLQREMAGFRSELDLLGQALDCFKFYTIPKADP